MCYYFIVHITTNGGIIIETLQQLLNMIKGRKPAAVAVACAHDSHVLEAVTDANKHGMAKFILIGNEAKIRDILSGLGANARDYEILDSTDDTEAARTAVKIVSGGSADAVMKGLLDTSVIMKAALDKEIGIRTGRKLSHLAMFSLKNYHKPLFVTDCAVNIAPDFESKKEIIQNAVSAVSRLDIKNPKVALICAKEKVDPKMPVTLEYEELVRMNRDGVIADCIIDGPFALDNAVSKEAAEIKGIKSDVAGDADILLCPDIEAGNVLYKALTMFTDASVGGVLVGAKAPIILTSRSDSSENKLLSIAFGIIIGIGNGVNA